ncbi:MAG TPA: hypothetical protein VG389_24195 [Myxococcota bacterium]|jgi:hypothetical protein|nr:hypothetical protein [Myxococcota bacterium]
MAKNPPSKTFRGTLRHNPIAGGHWTLEAEDGTRYQIADVDPAALVDGRKVVVEGAVDKAAMGIAMTGPILRARSVRDV